MNQNSNLTLSSIKPTFDKRRGGTRCMTANECQPNKGPYKAGDYVPIFSKYCTNQDYQYACGKYTRCAGSPAHCGLFTGVPLLCLVPQCGMNCCIESVR